MGRGLELTAKGLAVSLFALGACSESSGEQTTPADAASSKVAAIIMGTIVHTEDKRGVTVGTRTYVDPYDLTKRENGFFPEGAQVPFACYVIGRLGVDADVRDNPNVPGEHPLQWSTWYKTVPSGPSDPVRWVPQPFAQTVKPLPPC